MAGFTLVTLQGEMTGWVEGTVQRLRLRPMYLLVLRERDECRPVVSVMTEAGLEQGQARLPLLPVSPPPVCSITLPCSAE